jgi:hypothetical protein
MTPGAFAKLALSLDGAVQGSHHGTTDFRAGVGGKIFATLGYPDAAHGMVKLTPDQQKMLVETEPVMFVPVKGKWGLGGATNVRLAALDVPTARSALAMAWQNVSAASKRAARPGGRGSARSTVRRAKAG